MSELFCRRRRAVRPVPVPGVRMASMRTTCEHARQPRVCECRQDYSKQFEPSIAVVEAECRRAIQELSARQQSHDAVDEKASLPDAISCMHPNADPPWMLQCDAADFQKRQPTVWLRARLIWMSRESSPSMCKTTFERTTFERVDSHGSTQ